MESDIVSIGEFLFKIVSAGLIAAGVIWRSVKDMIEKKVEEAVSKKLEGIVTRITSANSAAIESLRKEMQTHNENTDRTREEQIGRVTRRIDDLFAVLTKTWGHE